MVKNCLSNPKRSVNSPEVPRQSGHMTNLICIFKKNKLSKAFYPWALPCKY